MGRDTPAQFRSVVRGRLCKSIGRSWTRFSRGHAANGGRRARWRCRRIAAGDRPRSTAQPRSALTGVVGPNRPGGQPIRCCHSPNKLAKGSPPVSGTCRSALSDVSGATDGWRNAAKPFAGHGSASPGRHLQCESKKSPCGFLTFFPKRMGIFNQFFTHLLYVPFYTRLQIFILLSPNLTKLCHIKRDHPTNFYISL